MSLFMAGATTAWLSAASAQPFDFNAINERGLRDAIGRTAPTPPSQERSDLRRPASKSGSIIDRIRAAGGCQAFDYGGVPDPINLFMLPDAVERALGKPLIDWTESDADDYGREFLKCKRNEWQPQMLQRAQRALADLKPKLEELRSQRAREIEANGERLAQRNAEAERKRAQENARLSAEAAQNEQKLAQEADKRRVQPISELYNAYFQGRMCSEIGIYQRQFWSETKLRFTAKENELKQNPAFSSADFVAIWEKESALYQDNMKYLENAKVTAYLTGQPAGNDALSQNPQMRMQCRMTILLLNSIFYHYKTQNTVRVPQKDF